MTNDNEDIFAKLEEELNIEEPESLGPVRSIQDRALDAEFEAKAAESPRMGDSEFEQLMTTLDVATRSPQSDDFSTFVTYMGFCYWAMTDEQKEVFAPAFLKTIYRTAPVINYLKAIMMLAGTNLPEA